MFAKDCGDPDGRLNAVAARQSSHWEQLNK